MILVFSEGDGEDQDVGGVSFSYVKTMRQFFFFFFLLVGKRKGNLSTKQKHKGSHKGSKIYKIKES